MQHTLRESSDSDRIDLLVRCGMHLGAEESRDNDYFGPSVQPAARIMGAAHGGQILLSRAVVELAGERLPAEASLVDLDRAPARSVSRSTSTSSRIRGCVANSRRCASCRHAEQPAAAGHRSSAVVRRSRNSQPARNVTPVTLQGPGGIGKTRLRFRSRQSCSMNIRRVGCRACEPDRRRASSPSRWFRRRRQGGRLSSAAGGSRAVLQTGTRLLILDNCEHLIEPCAILAASSSRAGTLRIMASSREPLRTEGEATFLLSSLEIPKHGRPPISATLATFEAVRLLSIERSPRNRRFS